MQNILEFLVACPLHPPPKPHSEKLFLSASLDIICGYDKKREI